MRFETNIVGLRKITTDWETLQPGKRATQSRSAVNEDSGTPKDYVDYRGAARRARRRTPASGVHINFDRQLRVTTDVRIAFATVASKSGGPARRPAHLRLRSAQRAPDYSPPGLAPLRRKHKTHRRGSVMPSCANGGAQTKSPAEAGPVKMMPSFAAMHERVTGELSRAVSPASD